MSLADELLADLEEDDDEDIEMAEPDFDADELVAPIVEKGYDLSFPLVYSSS